jgi:hypothetical protein
MLNSVGLLIRRKAEFLLAFAYNVQLIFQDIKKIALYGLCVGPVIDRSFSAPRRNVCMYVCM